ncbi:YciI family protein [Streptomyces sp. NPDC004012]
MVSDKHAQAKPDERHAGAQKVLFLCFTEPVELSPDEIRPYLGTHKQWLVDLERSGTLFLGGPMLDKNYKFDGSGLFVIRADSFAEADQIVGGDPFHAHGIRKYRLVSWQVNEGSFTVRLTLSDGTVEFR